MFVDPPGGSVITNSIGVRNATTCTLDCKVHNRRGFRISTFWFVQDFRSQPLLQVISDNSFPDLFSFGGDPVPTDPTRTYLNQLIFLNFTSELDGVTVFCGTGVSRKEAHFFIRVYSKLVIKL